MIAATVQPLRPAARQGCPAWCVEPHDRKGWDHASEPVYTPIGSAWITSTPDGPRVVFDITSDSGKPLTPEQAALLARTVANLAATAGGAR